MSRSVVFLFNDYPLHNAIVSDYVSARPSDRVALVKVPLVLKGKSRSETARRIVPQLGTAERQQCSGQRESDAATHNLRSADTP